MQKTLQTGLVRPRWKAISTFAAEHRHTIIEIISALFILLFVYTALSKLTGFANFRNTLWRSPLLKDVSTFIAYAIPITELIISLFLFIPRTWLIGFYASLALMSVFTIYIAYMLLFEKDLPCSCGGVIQNMTWTQHLFFNGFFIFLSIISIKLLRRTS